jgi:hypothetical protein
MSICSSNAIRLDAHGILQHYLLPLCAAAAMQGIGNLGSVDSSLIPSPKPSLRSNAASTPSMPAAEAPFDAYSQGRLTYDLLDPFFERSNYTPVDYTCTGAGRRPHRMVAITPYVALHGFGWQSWWEVYHAV